MTSKYIRFVNVHFNKLFDSVMSSIPEEYLRFFTSAERQKLIKSRSKLLKFGTIEEKLYLMAKCGYRFALVIADSKKEFGLRKILRLLRIFRDKANFDRKGAITELKDAGLFMLGDVDFVKSMNVIAGVYSNVHQFTLLRDHTAINEKLYKYHQLHQDTQKEFSAIQDLDKLISHILMVSVFDAQADFFEQRFNISAREFVLLAFISRTRFQKAEAIKKYISVLNINQYMCKLKDKKMIEAIIVKDQSEFYITGHGEVTLNAARNYFLTSVYN